MQSVEVYIKSFESYLNSNPLAGEPASLYEAANYIMKLGGKRLRPVMVLMACDAFKGNMEEALPASMAIEVFHNFTLIHDDIMDAAPIRRGKSTVHEKWNEPTAILAGDMMMFAASGYLHQVPDTIFKEVLVMFNTTAIEVCNGQQLDMLFESRTNVTLDEYLQMITLKTSVLLGCSFYLGARIGGASINEANALYEFGKNMGIAFQLHDDILDAFASDQAAFGKQVGGDILANKKTYLLITALRNAEPSQLEKLHYWLNTDSVIAAEKVNAVKELFMATHAKDEAEKEQQHFYNKALQSLEHISIPEEIKNSFKAFAEFVMLRKK